MSKDFHIFLYGHENAALITFDGKLEGILIKNNNDYFQNSDVVQELMVGVMKDHTAKEGRWVWKISERWRSVAGWELKGESDGFYDMYYM